MNCNIFHDFLPLNFLLLKTLERFFGSSSGPAVSYHGSGGWIPSDFDGFGRDTLSHQSEGQDCDKFRFQLNGRWHAMILLILHLIHPFCCFLLLDF